MPQIGPLEILVVGIIALIVFGPEKLPEIARSVGRAASELRRMASDVKSEFESGLSVEAEPEDESKKAAEDEPERSKKKAAEPAAKASESKDSSGAGRTSAPAAQGSSDPSAETSDTPPSAGAPQRQTNKVIDRSGHTE